MSLFLCFFLLFFNEIKVKGCGDFLWNNIKVQNKEERIYHYQDLSLSLLWNMSIEAGGGAGAQSVTVKPTGCGFDSHSRRWNIYLNLYINFFALVLRQSAALSSATRHAMPPELGRKWGTEWLNTRFPLSTQLYAGYSVKLIFIYYYRISLSLSQPLDVYCWQLDTSLIDNGSEY